MTILEPTVFEVKEDKTDQQIKALRHRREQQAEALEALRQAVCKLYRKESVLYADIEQFLLFSNNPQATFWMERSKLKEKIKQEAFGLWLKLEGGKLKIKPEFAESALGFVPDEVQSLSEAWEAVDKLGTENPRRYWSDTAQQFKPVPVSAKEQNEIERRNTMTVHKPELKTIIKKLREEVQLMNLANLYYDAGINMAKIRQSRPELVPFLGRKDAETGRGLKTTEFFLNEKMLLQSLNPDYKAFDEQ